MATQRKTSSFSLDADVIDHLGELTEMAGISKNRLVNVIIRMTDPQDQRLLDAIEEDKGGFVDGRGKSANSGTYDRKEAEKKRVQQAIQEMTKDELAHVLTQLTETQD